MQKKQIRKFYEEMTERLTDKKFLKEVGVTKKEMLLLLQSGGWRDRILSIVAADRVSCGEVLDVWRNLIDALSPEPEEGWLNYILCCAMNQLFPESVASVRREVFEPGRLFYLRVLRYLLEWEAGNAPFDPSIHLEFLPLQEAEETEPAEEYRRLLQLFHQQYIYEFMRIGAEVTPYNTLAHIAGVHYIAMHVARQLHDAGVPVDLALVSGAALGHDIGKYGCRPEESSRIPYLHYYYTDRYFKRNQMPVIGHIATNHSTWDLELENLSVESLVLIYADFRVKSSRDGQRELIRFYSLAESFDVILSKLDNVNAEKRARYEKVYAKLKDFEDYMTDLGVNTDLSNRIRAESVLKNPALLNSEEVLRRLRHLAIRHNILVMHKLNSEAAFGNLLEAARSEKNWKNMREYINIFQEYFTYMTKKQMLKTLKLLYELLMHREGDIRRQSADLLGNIIVHFDEEYRKELPEGVVREEDEITSLELWETYLNLVVSPDHKVTDQHRRWLWYTLKLIIGSVLGRCKAEEVRSYLNGVLRLYADGEKAPAAFVLLDSALAIPLSACRAEEKRMLLRFAAPLAGSESLEIRTAALRLILYLTEDEECKSREAELLIQSALKAAEEGNRSNAAGEGTHASLAFLKYKISRNLDINGGEVRSYEDILRKDQATVSGIFLENLKAATPWVTKLVNIELMLDQIRAGDNSLPLQVAAHLSNLVKVSERVAVRHSAGSALLAVVPYLTLTQRNEIAVEMSKGLEIGEYEFSKYIPQYLGKLALHLHPNELDELILDFKKMQYSSSDRVCSVTLDTLGVMLQNYPVYRERFQEDEEARENRRVTMLGLVLKGLADYREAVSQEAFLVIGQYLFGGSELSLGEKQEIFAILHKKLLTLIADRRETELSFFGSASALNHIYRFLSELRFHAGDWKAKDEEKIAFFPGSFDPFSRGHKEIIDEIRKHGFTVYLAVDEFSWSKKTQPKLIRRQIASMSVADKTDVFLFPDDIPVNIANPLDLVKLKELFPEKEIYLVVGSDVIKNASSHQKPPEENSVHSFHHIIFQRTDPDCGSGETERTASERYPMISGKILELTLPREMDEVSSTQIRENIDDNRDITNLIDPIAQSFIYDNSLYLREPRFKQAFSASRIETEILSGPEIPVGELLNTVFCDRRDREELRAHLQRAGTSCAILRGGGQNGLPIAGAIFHEIGMTDIYGEFGDMELSNNIRRITSGKIIVLTAISACRDAPVKNPEQMVLTEALAHCLKNDYTYAMYHSFGGAVDADLSDLLERQGFQELEADCGIPVYAVDMKFPVAIFRDIETIVKEPFNQRRRVLETVEVAHRRLQRAITKLYPGNLVISFDSGMMNHRIMGLITAANGVSDKPQADRSLGSMMCVPFGKVLHGLAVPNTVTKSLHTEKVFASGVKSFRIKEFPYYSSLRTQVRTIGSFQRPVILVDDLLHKGFRIKEIDPLFKQEQVEVEKIIVGILSGRGKDLMAVQGRSVESVYFIPSLRLWFDESSLYPFLGGDGIGEEQSANAGLIPSINLILPYAAPSFLINVTKDALYNFSMTCLENALQIITAVEEEYQQVFERNLTLNRLSEAVLFPRYPDKGVHMRYDMNLAPSGYILNDIENLRRLKNLIANK